MTTVSFVQPKAKERALHQARGGSTVETAADRAEHRRFQRRIVLDESELGRLAAAVEADNR